MYVCMHVCMYVRHVYNLCMYVCICDVCMRARMHACMYACMHVCMYVCMYALSLFVAAEQTWVSRALWVGRADEPREHVLHECGAAVSEQLACLHRIFRHWKA